MDQTVPEKKRRLAKRKRASGTSATRLREQLAVETNGLTRRLAEGIRTLRLERGLTQKDAAQKAGVELGHWEKLESGLVNATLRTLRRVAIGLEVDPTELFAPCATEKQ